MPARQRMLLRSPEGRVDRASDGLRTGLFDVGRSCRILFRRCRSKGAIVVGTSEVSLTADSFAQSTKTVGCVDAEAWERPRGAKAQVSETTKLNVVGNYER